jgi:hypothetical protein
MRGGVRGGGGDQDGRVGRGGRAERTESTERTERTELTERAAPVKRDGHGGSGDGLTQRQRRGAAWSSDEEVALVNAFVHVPYDSVNGTIRPLARLTVAVLSGRIMPSSIDIH